MVNHVHVILRNRPDVVAGWSDEEVARRWWQRYFLVDAIVCFGWLFRARLAQRPASIDVKMIDHRALG